MKKTDLKPMTWYSQRHSFGAPVALLLVTTTLVRWDYVPGLKWSYGHAALADQTVELAPGLTPARRAGRGAQGDATKAVGYLVIRTDANDFVTALELATRADALLSKGGPVRLGDLHFLGGDLGMQLVQSREIDAPWQDALQKHRDDQENAREQQARLDARGNEYRAAHYQASELAKQLGVSPLSTDDRFGEMTAKLPLDKFIELATELMEFRKGH